MVALPIPWSFYLFRNGTNLLFYSRKNTVLLPYQFNLQTQKFSCQAVVRGWSWIPITTSHLWMSLLFLECSALLCWLLLLLHPQIKAHFSSLKEGHSILSAYQHRQLPCSLLLSTQRLKLNPNNHLAASHRLDVRSFGTRIENVHLHFLFAAPLLFSAAYRIAVAAQSPQIRKQAWIVPAQMRGTPSRTILEIWTRKPPQDSTFVLKTKCNIQYCTVIGWSAEFE